VPPLAVALPHRSARHDRWPRTFPRAGAVGPHAGVRRGQRPVEVVGGELGRGRGGA
jgi:hypothetical protein